MHIYIDSIDNELSVEGDDLGYRITFRSDLTSGTALLVASHDGVGPSLQGKDIFVEIEAQSFLEMRTLRAKEAHEYRLTALPEERSYQAVGEVVYVDAESGPFVSVRVDDAVFNWTPDVTDRAALSIGNWVSFKVIGLVLWDMNL